MNPLGAGARVEGLPELRRALAAADGDLADLKDANRQASAIVLATAERTAPRRTGRLAASGRTNKAVAKANVAFGSAAVPYAAAVHWGSRVRNIAPRPWVTDAAEQTRTEWLKAYADAIQKIADRINQT